MRQGPYYPDASATNLLDNAARPMSFSADGRGFAGAKPDDATIAVGCRVRNTDPAIAQAEHDTIMTKVFTALR